MQRLADLQELVENFTKKPAGIGSGERARGGLFNEFSRFKLKLSCLALLRDVAINHSSFVGAQLSFRVPTF